MFFDRLLTSETTEAVPINTWYLIAFLKSQSKIPLSQKSQRTKSTEIKFGWLFQSK